MKKIADTWEYKVECWLKASGSKRKLQKIQKDGDQTKKAHLRLIIICTKSQYVNLLFSSKFKNEKVTKTLVTINSN